MCLVTYLPIQFINENAPEVALVPVEQFDAVAQKLAEAQALESKPAEVKRTQNVLTERGWDLVED